MSIDVERQVEAAETIAEGSGIVADTLEDVDANIVKEKKELKKLRILGVVIWSLAILVVVARAIYG